MKENFYLKEYAKYLADIMYNNHMRDGSLYLQILEFSNNSCNRLMYKNMKIKTKILYLKEYRNMIIFITDYIKTFEEFNTELNTEINRTKKLKQLIK